MHNAQSTSQRVRAERLYLLLVIGIPLLAMVAYFVFVFVLRDRSAPARPPAGIRI